MNTFAYENRLVSIITPVYNKEQHVAEAIESVMAQNYAEWELILIDDASSDDSRQVIRPFLDRDPKLRYIRLDRNEGAAYARNVGLEAARGRYVAFLDADDVWMPGKLEKQLDLMRSGGYGFSYTAIELIDEDGRVLKKKRKIAPVVDYLYLLCNTVIACSSVVLDRQIVGDVRMPPVRKGQDFATWLSILRRGVKAYGIDEVYVKYRISRGSISSNKLGALRRTWNIYRNVEHIHLFPACFYFSMYVLNAVKKYKF